MLLDQGDATVLATVVDRVLMAMEFQLLEVPALTRVAVRRRQELRVLKCSNEHCPVPGPSF